MQAVDLRANIDRDDLPPVLLFAPGKAPFQKEPWEPMLAEQAVEAITRRFVDDDNRDLAYTAFYADETPASEVAQEANTLPFLVEHRVILVRNADKYIAAPSDKKSPVAPLLEYISDPCPGTYLLLVAPKADKRKAFYKAVDKAGGVVECPQLSDDDLVKWIRREAKIAECEITPGAAQELVGRAGSRLGDVRNALNLLVTYVGDEKRITEDDVIHATADVAEETVWALTDAIAASDPDKALGVLYELLDLGKSPDEIMGIINWLLESAYRAAPESQATLQSKFVARKVSPLVQKLGLEKLKRAFSLCTETHFMIRSTGVDKMLALELLVIKLSSPRKRRVARR
jgi:DNA polymerase-3 subunit delta